VKKTPRKTERPLRPETRPHELGSKRNNVGKLGEVPGEEDITKKIGESVKNPKAGRGKPKGWF